MIIDTSVLLTILFDEPERRHFNELIASISPRRISSGTYLETAIVLQCRYGKQALLDLKLFLSAAVIEVAEFDPEQAEIAAKAYAEFGKGKHPAGLNYGDCFSYALSKHTLEPLLFKGDDFRKTDVEAVT
jgi:ribonuclease VapC